jgi:hypothetical protein
VVIGEELGIDGDGVDEVLLVRGDGEAFAAALGDILGWAGYVVFFVCVKITECLARAVWVVVCPNLSYALGVDCA